VIPAVKHYQIDNSYQFTSYLHYQW